MSWGTVPDWISAMASVAMALAAYGALHSWREQLRGTTKHDVALELATLAKTLRYHFFEARSPMYEAWEFPTSYYEANQPRTTQVEYESWKHVFQARWNDLWPHILGIAKARPRVSAVLGDAIANDAEALARVARMLRFYMDHVLEMKRVGPEIVRMWGDQEFVKIANNGASLHSGKPDDKYSQEFDAALERVLKQLKEFLD